MYALSHDLACRRILYPRPLPTLPDILLIDVPPRFAHTSLPLGRYYPIVVETGAEHREVEAFLTAPRNAPVQPALLDRRGTALETSRIVFAAFAPPAADWPHVLLCHWPAHYVALAADCDLFARGAYTSEVFDTFEELAAAANRLLAVLGDTSLLSVTLIGGNLACSGHA